MKAMPDRLYHKGILQYDMWDDITPGPTMELGRAETGDCTSMALRNSLLLALMPTASTSQILGNNECFEPYTSNLYTRRVLSGEFIVVNKHLMQRSGQIGLWNEASNNKSLRTTDRSSKLKKSPLISRSFIKPCGRSSKRH